MLKNNIKTPYPPSLFLRRQESLPPQMKFSQVEKEIPADAGMTMENIFASQ